MFWDSSLLVGRSLAKVTQGVRGHTIAPHFKVAVLGRRITCTANSGNPLPRGNNISNRDEQPVVMGVKSLDTSTMIKDNGLSIALHFPAIDHLARRGSGHGLSLSPSDVQPGVPVTTAWSPKR